MLAHLFPRFDWHAFSQLLPGGKVCFKYLFFNYMIVVFEHSIQCKNGLNQRFSYIIQESAVSVFYPREDMVDQGYTTFGYMKMQMVVAHGGRCAERVVFGDDVTDGGKDDLEKITKVSALSFSSN